jgi:putative Holliday junction resolvase
MTWADKNLLGIDYGTKRVGVALSPAGSTLAFPHDVYENTRHLIDRLVGEVQKHQIEAIILGESFNFAGRENIIMEDIRELETKLREELPEVLILYEPEFYTSAQAERLQGKGERLDASAATLILQAYIDKQNVKNT